MKARLTTIVMMLICITHIHAQTTIDIVTGETVDKTALTIPQQTVETFDNGVRVTYTFDYVSLDSISIDGSDKFIFSFDSFGLCNIPGYPRLPSRINALEVPSISQASLCVEEFEYSEYHMEIAPAREPDSESAITVTQPTLQPISVGPGFFPQQPASICHTESSRGKELCFIKVSPILYDHSTHTVRIANKISYRLSFGDVDASAKLLRRTSVSDDADQPINDDFVYSNIILNAKASEPNRTGIVRNGLLIVSTYDFFESVHKFAKWKNRLGIKTYTLIKNKWNSFYEARDSVLSYCNKYPDIQYLLLVGDANHIPSMIEQSRFNLKPDNLYYTDYYYGIEGYDFQLTPLLHKGRIPASNDEEAAIAFNKIINYERCEDYSPAFFQQALHCAVFIPNRSNRTSEERRFIHTSEEILESARDNGIYPQRVYYTTEANYRPLFYSDDPTYGKGDPLSSELTDFSFPWISESTPGQGSQQIKRALEDRACYVLYRGHGGASGWIAPNYTVDDIEQEAFPSNGLFPVIFSLCCQTGNFYEPGQCFAAKSLLTENGGSSCIFAATEDLYSGYNDGVSLAMFDAFLPNAVNSSYMTPRNESQAYEPVYRMGQILDQALFRMTEREYPDLKHNYTLEQYHRLHCFGDPTMWMRFQEPTPFENAEVYINYDKRLCGVSTGEGPAYISFYDSKTDSIQCYYGEYAEFQFSQLHKNGSIESDFSESITISAPNRIPYIYDQWQYDVEDETIPQIISYKFESGLNVTYRYSAPPLASLKLTNATTGLEYYHRMVAPSRNETTITPSTAIKPGTICILSLIANGKPVDSRTIIWKNN